MFINRQHAGRELAAVLTAYHRAPGGLVLALPRGGVIVGAEISAVLELPLDVFISLKLRFPDFPEVALGAVTEIGSTYLNRELQDGISLPEGYLDDEKRIRREEVDRRRLLYRGVRALPPIDDKTVILVDDGIATGSTFLAALEAIRNRAPRRLIAAVPVATHTVLAALESRCDELAVFWSPESFNSVGEFYASFEPVSDELVLKKLLFCHTAAVRRERQSALKRYGLRSGRFVAIQQFRCDDPERETKP